MSFSLITQDLQAHLKREFAQIRFLLKKNPAMAYTKITEIGFAVGSKYNVKLVVNFPHEGKIEEFDKYGKRDLSIIIDQTKTRFPIDREIIKQKAKTIINDVKAIDAYMYEGKEGVKIFIGSDKDRIDILPHSLHIWCEFTAKVTEFCDWLLCEVYQLKT